MDPPPEVNIPLGLKTVLEWFSRAAVVIQPCDIKQFACFYFSQLLRFRDENPNLDIFELVKEFHEAKAGDLTSHGTETHNELLSQMAAEYKDYLNEDGILSILAGADQTEAVVVFRRTHKIKHSETGTDNILAADGTVSTCRRRSGFFERVPLSEIEFTSNTVLIKTSSIPCKYMIVVHSEKVPECIVFQKESVESLSQPCEETGQEQEGPQPEEIETPFLYTDMQIESALATSSIPDVMETSSTADVKSELTELIRKFKTFMSRLVSPQQESKECSETESDLPTPGPTETASSLEQPQISSLGESSKQEAVIPSDTAPAKVAKSRPACPLTFDPEEVATFDLTCSPVSTSHGPFSLTSTAKDTYLDVQANKRETMMEGMMYQTSSSPKTMTTASVLANQTGVSGDPVKATTMSLEHPLATADLTSTSTNLPVSNPGVNVSAPLDVTSPSVLSPEAFQEPPGATPCYLHVHQHMAPHTHRLSQQTHSYCSSRESSHHTIRPATCCCNWRLCHIMLPESVAMTCSARSMAVAQDANEHLLIPDHPRVPVYQDLSACSSIYHMQPDAACPCQTTCPVSSSCMRLHTASALLSSDHHYRHSHDAVLPRHIFFKSLPHGRHAVQAVDCQGCMLAAAHCDESHQCVAPGQCSQQECYKREEH